MSNLQKFQVDISRGFKRKLVRGVINETKQVAYTGSIWSECQRNSVLYNPNISSANIQNTEKKETHTSHCQTVVKQRLAQLWNKQNRSCFHSIQQRAQPVICSLNSEHKTDAVKAKRHFMFRLIGC